MLAQVFFVPCGIKLLFISSLEVSFGACTGSSLVATELVHPSAAASPLVGSSQPEAAGVLVESLKPPASADDVAASQAPEAEGGETSSHVSVEACLSVTRAPFACEAPLPLRDPRPRSPRPRPRPSNPPRPRPPRPDGALESLGADEESLTLERDRSVFFLTSPH